MDQRFEEMVEALAGVRGFKAIVAAYRAGKDGRSFGSNGLKVEGRIFAMGVRGNLVVKLPKARVAALVEAGHGEAFDPGHGRKMKEWVVIEGDQPSWLELAREAYAFVKG